MTWDINKPADLDNASEGPAAVRTTVVAMTSALDEQHTFPGADTVNPKANHNLPYGTTANRPAASLSYIGRWYYNTTTGTIQRDNGTTWDDLTQATGLFPSGTKCVFYQASAPTGWLIDASYSDRMLRIVSGAGGGTGGDWTPTTSTVYHNHDTDSTSTPFTHSLTQTSVSNCSIGDSPSCLISGLADHAYSHTHGLLANDVGHAHTGDGSWRPYYADVIICTRN